MDENITEKESAEPSDVQQVSDGEGGKEIGRAHV